MRFITSVPSHRLAAYLLTWSVLAFSSALAPWGEVWGQFASGTKLSPDPIGEWEDCTKEQYFTCGGCAGDCTVSGVSFKICETEDEYESSCSDGQSFGCGEVVNPNSTCGGYTGCGA